MRSTILIATAAAVMAVIALTSYRVWGQGMMGQGMMNGPMMQQGQNASADASGEKVFKDDCSACHTLGKGETGGVGPNLHGLIGRKAASIEGFDYSKGMRGSGIVWSAETLDKFLADPGADVPGTEMPVSGVKDAGERKALIAYLEQATK